MAGLMRPPTWKMPSCSNPVTYVICRYLGELNMYILRPMKYNNGKLANIVVSYINLGSYFYPVLCGALGGA